MTTPTCWCGNPELVEFSAEYLRCAACETLVTARMPDPADLQVRDDDRDFYGKHYFERMEKDLGLLPLRTRMRVDLPERCMHWLRGLVKYKQPPARVLELGSAHGAFVAMLRWTGFEATGLDLSPGLAEAARQAFGVPMHTGCLESQDIPAGSLDAIVLMDVLEHLSDPCGTLRTCLGLLKSDGIFFLQTPQYREGKTFEQMGEENDPFLDQLKANQHLYLFSRSSVRELFRQVGVNFVQFEPAIFSQYDMALAASRMALAPIPIEEIETRLMACPQGRMLLALLDIDTERQQLRDRSAALQRQLAASEADCARRHDELFQREKRSDASDQLLERLHHSYVYRLMRGIGLWSWLTPKVLPSAALRPLRRIAIDLTHVLPGGDNGGSKVMTLTLIRELARTVPGCELLLLTSESAHQELAELEGASVRRICVNRPDANPPEAWAGLSNAFRDDSKRSRGGLLQDLRVDLLFCPFTAPHFFDPTIPMVSVIYDLQHVFYPQFFDEADLRERERNAQRALRLSTKVVCISDYVRRTVLEHFGADPSMVETIYITAPRRLARPQPGDRHVLDAFGLKREDYLLYPANFWLHKNHELLLAAYEQYRALHPLSELKLVLTGAPGPRRDRLIDLCRRKGLSQHVVFPGFISEDRFSALMNGCLAVIIPSLFEGFGMPVLEAMTAGKPVLCSNCTSLPEVAGGAALLFDPRSMNDILDAITRITLEPKLRRELQERGARRVATISGPEEMTSRYLRVFRDVVQVPVRISPGLYGAFGDGWLKERGTVSVGPGNAPRELVLKASLPDWAPVEKITLRFTGRSFRPALFEILRGQFRRISIPLGPDATVLDFACGPAFQPRALGQLDDARRLTCQLHVAEVVEASGAVVRLESEGYAT